MVATMTVPAGAIKAPEFCLPRLSGAVLDQIADPAMVPNYDRSQLKIGQMHIGGGKFAKGFMFPLVDAAIERRSPGWENYGVSVVSFNRDPSALREQDGLYTMVQRGPDHDTFKVIGCVKEARHFRADAEGAFRRFLDPNLSLVTLTITEAGFCLDPEGKLDLSDPRIARCLDSRNPQDRSAIGFLVEGLSYRYSQDLPPPIIMSLDNIVSGGNGAKLKAAIVAYASKKFDSDSAFVQWLESELCCPNAMCDRIVPCAMEEERLAVAAQLGVADESIAVGESFGHLVFGEVPAERCGPLLQNFVARSGAAEEAALNLSSVGGVQVVNTADVDSFMRLKYAMVNGMHVAIGWLGTAAGLEYVHEVVANSDIQKFLRALMSEELAPFVAEALQQHFDVKGYVDDVLERLANPRIRDRLDRLTGTPSVKIPDRLLQHVTAIFSLADGTFEARVGRLVLPIACFVRSVMGGESVEQMNRRDIKASGFDDLGRRILVTDTGEAKRHYAEATNFVALLENPLLTGRLTGGANLLDDPRFFGPFFKAYYGIVTRGVLATIRDFNADGCLYLNRAEYDAAKVDYALDVAKESATNESLPMRRGPWPEESASGARSR